MSAYVRPEARGNNIKSGQFLTSRAGHCFEFTGMSSGWILGYGTYWEIGLADYLPFMETSELSAKAQNLREKAQGYTEKAREWQRTATETARNTGRVIHEYVHENAWLSIAIAAAVGCALGMLLSRDSD